MIVRLLVRIAQTDMSRQIIIKLKGERGEHPMDQSTFEHVGQQIDDTTHKATRAASTVADALEDSVVAARRVARDGADAATELLYNTKKRLQRHPLETVAITFAIGIAAGTAIGWMMKRGKSQQQSE
jgi:hypothetical protein